MELGKRRVGGFCQACVQHVKGWLEFPATIRDQKTYKVQYVLDHNLCDLLQDTFGHCLVLVTYH
jgi:hypothetical protein